MCCAGLIVCVRAPVQTSQDKRQHLVADASARTEPAVSVSNARNVFQQREQAKNAEIAQRTREIANAPGFKEVNKSSVASAYD